MIYQDELMDAESVAVWVGDFETEDDFTTYLGQPFERDFGFLLDDEDFPGDAVVLPERRTRARYDELLQRVTVVRLLSQWSDEDWIQEAERKCLERGIGEAKAMLRFLNLRYREELCRSSNPPLKFVGNVPWPGGRERWDELQSRTIHVPPFPSLRRQKWEDGTLSSWRGRVQLQAWRGFATREELADEWMSFRFSAWPEGDFKLAVEAVMNERDARPTGAQARAFAHLLENEASTRDAVLKGVFDLYPKWRDSFEDTPDLMPSISDAADLKRLIRPGTVHVMRNEKEGFTAVGFGLHCKWDTEHGLGVLTHKGKVLEVGAAETAFSELPAVDSS